MRKAKAKNSGKTTQEAEEAGNNTILSDKRNFWIIGIIFVFFFLLLTPLGKFAREITPSIDRDFFSVLQIDTGDDWGYYAYLRSAVIDGDIDFLNERPYWWSFCLTSTGYTWDPFPVGCAILWLPSFLVGHVCTLVLNLFGYPVPADGYSFPYLLATGAGSSLTVFFALLICYTILRKFSSPFASLLATLTVFLSTPVIYFTFIQSRMAHAGEFFLTTVFLAFWLHWRENRNNHWICFIFGAIAGFVFEIRYNAGTVFVIVFLDILHEYYSGKKSLREIFSFYLSRTPAFLGGFFLVALPQFVSWLAIFGKISIPAGQSTVYLPIFLNPLTWLMGFGHFLFSPRWGVVFSQPVWIPAIIGLALYFKQHRFYGISFFSALSINVCLNVIFLCGNVFNQYSFGWRLLAGSNIFLCIGFAWLIDHFRSIPRAFWIALCALFVTLNYFQLIQYRIFLDWNHPSFVIQSILNIPMILSNYFQALLRSSCYFNVMSLGSQVCFSFPGWIFMIALPGMLIGSVSISTMAFYKVFSPHMSATEGQDPLRERTQGVDPKRGNEGDPHLGQFLSFQVFPFKENTQIEIRTVGLLIICFFLVLDFFVIGMYKPFSTAQITNRLVQATEAAIITNNMTVAMRNFEVAEEINLPSQFLEPLQMKMLIHKISPVLGNLQGRDSFDYVALTKLVTGSLILTQNDAFLGITVGNYEKYFGIFFGGMGKNILLFGGLPDLAIAF